MRVSVILSTYNSPGRLELALWGYARQKHRDFEIVVADDGSTEDTRDLINTVRVESGLDIRHVWHEDDGFQKCRILNQATSQAACAYLVYSDGDCIPRDDFLATHIHYAQRGRFLSGGYFKLNSRVSSIITRSDVEAGRPFDARWLREHGMRWNRRFTKLQARGPFARVLNHLTTTQATWNGHNASGWKQDILNVNGFDERMKYGGQDRELGERLFNNGLKSKQIRYSAICIHLDHDRGYVDHEAWARNYEIRRETKAEQATWTEFGIVRGASPAGSTRGPGGR